MKTPLLGDLVQCLGMGRGTPSSHQRDWVPTAPHGKGQLQTASGFSAAWGRETWVPGPWQGGTREGQLQAAGDPTSLGDR
jgi:hypothetical protein